MPVGARFSSITSLPLIITSMVTFFSGKTLRGLGVGKVFTRSLIKARQLLLTGQSAHLGLLRVQMVAPKSIKPCV